MENEKEENNKEKTENEKWTIKWQNLFQKKQQKAISQFQQANNEMELKNYTKSKKLYKKSLKNNPNSKFSYYNFGRLLFTLQKYSQAIKNFKLALKIDKNYLLALIGLGNSFFH